MNELPLFPIARGLLTVAGLEPFADDTQGYRFQMTQETLNANTLGEATDLPKQLYGYPVEVVEHQVFELELSNDANTWIYNTRSVLDGR